MAFKAGFVNIIGLPNAGKSTLSNALVGERLSIVTPKAQTTRRRILGIVNEPELQIVFSDTPGIIEHPEYKLQEWMNQQIMIALQDADVIVYLATPGEKPDLENRMMNALSKTDTPVIIAVNKADTMDAELLKAELHTWELAFPNRDVRPLSALHKAGLTALMEEVRELLPEHPPYFDTDALTDQNERFFVSEIIREKMLEQYHQEIPYAVEIAIEEYKEKDDIDVIRAVIYVIRESQKGIILGNKGSAIKKLGMESRKAMEEWLGKKVFLELFVKVKGDWKDDDRMLKQFGYQ
jgi:GTP-binding protein Era